MVSGPIVALAVVAVVDVEMWLMAFALTFGILIPSALGTANECLTIENRSDRSAQLAMVENLLLQVAVMVTVLTLGTPDGVWSARTVTSGLMMLLPVWFISRRYRGAVLRPRPPWSLPRKFWRFAIPTFAAGILGGLAVSRTQVIFLDWFSDPVAMGLFSLAFGLAAHVYAPAQAFVGPMTPAVSGLSEVDPEAMQRAFLRSTRAASAVGGAFVATALPALALLIPIMYGEEFAGAADLLMVLGFAGAVSLVGSPHHAFLMARLAGIRLLWVNLVALLVNVVIALLLIPFLGAWGATLSCAAGIVVRSLQLSVGEARSIRIGLRSLLRSSASIYIGASVASIAWLLVGLSDIHPVMLATGVVGFGGGLYVLGLKATRTGMSEMDVAAIGSAFPARMAPWVRRGLWLLKGTW